LQKIDVPADLIGGVALGSYNYIRNTEDVDILIDKSNFSKVANAIVDSGGQYLGKENKLSLFGHTIQICYNGLKVHKTIFPKPSNTIAGLSVIGLPNLLAMKIEAGMSQQRHRSDFVELVKRNNISLEYLKDNVYQLLDKDSIRWGLALWKIAKKELDEGVN
jgi:hypothetical protein